MLTRVIGAVGRLLVLAGLLVLGFVAYQLWGTGLEETRQQGDLTTQLAESLGDAGDAQTAAASDPAELAEALAERDPVLGDGVAPPTEGEPVGIIEIPRIEVARVVVQGTSRADLKKGPGHYVGTPLPGQPGNVGIAGHRTTYGAPFNRIDELVPGDEIVLSTAQGRFTYEVIPAPGSADQAWYTVDPSQGEVLDDMGDNRVTLTACHPKYSARQRIVVHGILTGEAAEATGTLQDSSAQVVRDFDEDLASTPEELPRAVAWGLLAAAVGIVAWLVARRARHPWIVWVVAAPVALFLVWNAYVHLDRYLPAI